MNRELGEQRPRGGGWRRLPGTTTAAQAESWWTDGGVVVGSSLVMADLPDGSGRTGLQHLVSVSGAGGKRPTRAELRRALSAFGFLGAEEDNHFPGIARHFWRPVDVAARVDCQCKEDELVVEEPDGYRWTTPRNGVCRGCELQALLGNPCPLHSPATTAVSVRMSADVPAADDRNGAP